MENSNNTMNFGKIFHGNNLVKDDDLSPVSVLRLNFDRLPTETTDPITLKKNVFGVPVPEFLPDSILSWIDNSNADFQINQHDLLHQSNILTTDNVIELSNTVFIQKVCEINLCLSPTRTHTQSLIVIIMCNFAFHFEKC